MPTALEQQIVDAIALLRFPLASVLAKAITFLGEWWVLLIATVLLSLVLFQQKRMTAAFVFTGGYVSLVLVIHFLKGWIERPRPTNALIEDTLFSFPSAHSALAMYFFVFVAFVLATRIKSKSVRALVTVILLVAPFLISFTRLYLGIHYPSDIIFGLLLGVIFAYGCIQLIRSQNNLA